MNAKIAKLRRERANAMKAARVARALGEPAMVAEMVDDARFQNRLIVRMKRLHKIAA
jgi:hypothetical protein